MKAPTFSPWQNFDELRHHEVAKFPGVYLLAHFDTAPQGNPVLTSPQIIYVGETTGQKITKRLYDFSRSAFYQMTGHSGGWTYSRKVLENRLITSTPGNLYACASSMRYDVPDMERKAFIKLVERLVIWEFYQENKRYPLCNSA